MESFHRAPLKDSGTVYKHSTFEETGLALRKNGSQDHVKPLLLSVLKSVSSARPTAFLEKFMSCNRICLPAVLYLSHTSLHRHLAKDSVSGTAEL